MMRITRYRQNSHLAHRLRLPLFAAVGVGTLVALAAVATPAMAARPGAPIVEAQQAVTAAAGLRAVVKHADGTSSTYNHLSRLAVTGGHVAVGQTVGYLGSTGNSTGPHLHLEIVDRQGTLIDPLTWLQKQGVAV